MAPTVLALGSVVNAEPESAGWLLIGSIYVTSGSVNLLALNELVQCIHSLDRMSQYNVAYLCDLSTSDQPNLDYLKDLLGSRLGQNSTLEVKSMKS